RVARLNALYRDYRAHLIRTIDQAPDESPLDVDDLPPAVMEPYIGAGGRLVLAVNPRLPPDSDIQSAYDPRFLPVFINQARSIDPNVTGVPVQVYESGAMIRDAYVRAGLLSL